MMTFREFLLQQDCLEERFVGKGVVATYAAQGKTHGDKAMRHYNDAMRAFVAYDSRGTVDQKISVVAKAMVGLLNGLVATRQQLGSVSAQITALSLTR